MTNNVLSQQRTQMDYDVNNEWEYMYYTRGRTRNVCTHAGRTFS